MICKLVLPNPQAPVCPDKPSWILLEPSLKKKIPITKAVAIGEGKQSNRQAGTWMLDASLFQKVEEGHFNQALIKILMDHNNQSPQPLSSKEQAGWKYLIFLKAGFKMFIKSAKQQFSYFPLIAVPFRHGVRNTFFPLSFHPLISSWWLVFSVFNLPGEGCWLATQPKWQKGSSWAPIKGHNCSQRVGWLIWYLGGISLQTDLLLWAQLPFLPKPTGLSWHNLNLSLGWTEELSALQFPLAWYLPEQALPEVSNPRHYSTG